MHLLQKISITYVLLASILEANSLKKNNDLICNQQDPCQCAFYYGLGINLHGFEAKFENKTLKVVFHPCSDITVGSERNGTNECAEGTSLCMTRPNITVNLGKSDSFQFSTSDYEKKITLISKYNLWSTYINLECTPPQERDKLNVTGIDMYTQEVYMTLSSSRACLTSNLATVRLPVWTIVFLVVVTILILYCVGGALLLKFVFGNEGPEVIPNYSFWNASYSRLKIFCTSCCEPSSGYDRI